MSRVTKRPQAEQDLCELADFIARDSLDAADRFLDAVEATFETLAGSPEIGGACNFRSPQTAGLRVWPVRGFRNHLVFYRPTPRGVDIVRVLHGARDLDTLFSERMGP